MKPLTWAKPLHWFLAVKMLCALYPTWLVHLNLSDVISPKKLPLFMNSYWYFSSDQTSMPLGFFFSFSIPPPPPPPLHQHGGFLHPSSLYSMWGAHVFWTGEDSKKPKPDSMVRLFVHWYIYSPSISVRRVKFLTKADNLTISTYRKLPNPFLTWKKFASSIKKKLRNKKVRSWIQIPPKLAYLSRIPTRSPLQIIQGLTCPKYTESKGWTMLNGLVASSKILTWAI